MDKITYKKYKEMRNDKILTFLKNANLKERHQLVQGWNWDGDMAVLERISNSPDTDKATALKIYWGADPFWQKQYASADDLPRHDWAISDYNFLNELESKYVSNFYKSQQFAYNPKNDENYDWTIANPSLEIKSEIPQIMFEKLIGEEILPNEELVEGIPPDIYKELSALYDLVEPKP